MRGRGRVQHSVATWESQVGARTCTHDIEDIRRDSFATTYKVCRQQLLQVGACGRVCHDPLSWSLTKLRVGVHSYTHTHAAATHDQASKSACLQRGESRGKGRAYGLQLTFHDVLLVYFDEAGQVFRAELCPRERDAVFP